MYTVQVQFVHEAALLADGLEAFLRHFICLVMARVTTHWGAEPLAPTFDKWDEAGVILRVFDDVELARVLSGPIHCRWRLSHLGVVSSSGLLLPAALVSVHSHLTYTLTPVLVIQLDACIKPRARISDELVLGHVRASHQVDGHLAHAGRATLPAGTDGTRSVREGRSHTSAGLQTEGILHLPRVGVDGG